MTTTSHPLLTRRHMFGLAIGAVALRPLAAQDQVQSVFTFAVLGTDYRTPDDPEHPDTIMVSRVDIGGGTVRTLSIPRDLYIEIPGQGFGKMNDPFNNAVKADPEQRWEIGAAATVATITHNFGLQIDGVALTTMSVFPQIIDAVGGVTVYNPYDLTDQYWPEGMVLPEGPLELDGELALSYVRARSQDGDGGRVMRQHLVLEAILERLQDPAMVPRIPELIESLRDVVQTDIPADVQARLLVMLPSLTSDDLTFGNIEPLLWAGYTDAGAWIYQGDWSVLPGYVESWLAGDIS